MSVDVADVAGCDIAVGERELHGPRCLSPVRTWRGHVIGVVRVRVTDDLGINPGAARHRSVALLEDEHRRSLAHHEAVAARVEGA